jgi:hypothetical protein
MSTRIVDFAEQVRRVLAKPARHHIVWAMAPVTSPLARDASLRER